MAGLHETDHTPACCLSHYDNSVAVSFFFDSFISLVSKQFVSNTSFAF